MNNNTSFAGRVFERRGVTLLTMVRYYCGCIGFPNDDSDSQAIIIDRCDKDMDDYNQYSMFYRNMEHKTSEKLSIEEERKTVAKIGALINDGYKMRDLALTIKAINRK